MRHELQQQIDELRHAADPLRHSIGETNSTLVRQKTEVHTACTRLEPSGGVYGWVRWVAGTPYRSHQVPSQYTRSSAGLYPGRTVRRAISVEMLSSSTPLYEKSHFAKLSTGAMTLNVIQGHMKVRGTYSALSYYKNGADVRSLIWALL